MFTLYHLLQTYISEGIYTSIEEVHEKIVVYHACEKLTDGEFMTLFNMLYPVEEVSDNDGCIETLELTEEVVIEAPVSHPMPNVALDVISKMVKADKLKNAEAKLNMYVQTGQLKEQQLVDMFEEEVLTEDIPTIIPEIIEE